MTESGLTLLVIYQRSIPPLSTGLRYWGQGSQEKATTHPGQKD